MTSPSAQIHPTADVEKGAEIGSGARIWRFCHVMPGAVIGPGTVLGQNVFVAGGVRCGRGCRIQNNVSLYEGVLLGDHVFVGPSAVFTNVTRPRAAFPRRDRFERTVVEDGATIGANATVCCGLTVGRGSFVAAGAVVARSVPPFTLVAGVPARVVGPVCLCGERPGAELVCSACGRAWRRLGEGYEEVSGKE